MDALVAQYGRPAFSDEALDTSEEEQQLTACLPNLSLKFALPPTPQVSHLTRYSITLTNLIRPHHGFAQ